MIKRLVTVSLIAVTMAAQADADSYKAGFRQYSFDANSERPVEAALFYPTTSDAASEVVAENKAFYGVETLPGSEIAKGRFPLVLLSHGMEGSWRNMSWIGKALAQEGYIVAAADHPGTTASNLDPKEAAKLWERPKDLSRLLDKLSELEELNDKFELDNISAIGHSLGGWTVMSMVGAKYNRQLLSQACTLKPDLRACKMINKLGLDKAELEQDLRDERIKQVVSLDLGLSSGFTPESLGNIAIPSLVIAAGEPFDDMPEPYESGYLYQFLNKALSRFIRLVGATHFSFVLNCKEGAKERIAVAAPGREAICDAENGVSRQALHDETIKDILQFLKR